MPFRFVCSQCGTLLLEDEDLPFNVGDYLKDVISRIGEKCPKCGHKLQIPPVNVEVNPNPAALKKPRSVGAFKHNYYRQKVSS